MKFEHPCSYIFPKTKMFNPAAADIFDEMLFNCHFPIHRACRDGDVKTVSMLLQQSTPLQSVFTEDCYKHLTPLHWASTFGSLDCIRQIVSVDPNVINAQSSESFRTPLHCVSDAGHTHCLLWLLQAGANTEVKDILGETALHKAAKNGKAQCVGLLVSTGCNVSIQNNFGQTPSMAAEQAGFMELATFIRQHEMLLHDLPQQKMLHGFPPARLNRKRTRDMTLCDETFKKMKTQIMEDAPVSPTNSSFMTNQMSTSVVDHGQLCTQESGYSSSLMDIWLSEIH